jgi:small-conductance mechanosensitive channel
VTRHRRERGGEDVARSVDVYADRLAPALPVSSLTRNVLWALTATIGLLVVLSGVGLSIPPMLTALGGGGLAVALALREPLANFFAGPVLTLAGQIRVPSPDASMPLRR